MTNRAYQIALLLILWSFSPAVGQDRLAALAALSDSFEALARQVNPAVVEIVTTGSAPVQGLVNSSDLFITQRRGGSGVILDPEGYIITNAHVVEGARKVQIRMASPSGEGTATSSILKPPGELLGAQIVGVDRETDLAVLKTFKKDLPFLLLGDSDEVRQGQLVFAFGSPRGLENSVSIGVVSATARQLRDEDPMIYIQTDAPINPGNSGGPLVDSQGNVVGINTMIISQSGGNEGLGFAAPSNIVRYVFEQLRKTGRLRRGQIGVRAQTISPLLAKGLGLAQDWGVVISDVHPRGPADEAGLQIGDVILSLDDKTMENGRQFQVNIYRHSVGETVKLSVLRGEKTLYFQTKVSERTNDPDRFADMVRPGENDIRRLGILGIELNDNIAAMLPGLRKKTGIVVAAISLDSPAFQTVGLFPGDVIFSINGEPVDRLSELREAVSALQKGDTAVLHIQRQGALVYVPMEIQ